MNVLSLFDGLSGARVALDRLGIKVDKYYASEIDYPSQIVSMYHYPDIYRVGDVRKLKVEDFKDIDLLIGGSPCQNLSIAGNRKGLNGEKSILFWEYIRILEGIHPKYFLLENVASMRNADKEIISNALKTEPILINSALVSAQNRRRYYWTNIPNIVMPEDRHIYLKDILETDKEGFCIAVRGRYVDGIVTQKIEPRTDGKTNTITSVQKDNMLVRDRNLVDLLKGIEYKSLMDVLDSNEPFTFTERRTEEAKQIRKEYREKFNRDFSPRRAKEIVPRTDGKSNTLTTSLTKEHWAYDNGIVRQFTPLECERLQTLPDNYTKYGKKFGLGGSPLANRTRYKMIGNGFTIDVIVELLRSLK